MKTSPSVLRGFAVWLRGRKLGEVWGLGLTPAKAVADPIFGLASNHYHFADVVEIDSIEVVEDRPPPPRPPKPLGFEERRQLDAAAQAAQTEKARERQVERARMNEAMEAHDAEIRRLRALTPDDELVWVQVSYGYRKGLWLAYGPASIYALAEVDEDRWVWTGHAAGETPETGEVLSVDEAKSALDLRWRWVVGNSLKPMTDKQKLAAYRKSLISKVRYCGPEEHGRALSAIKALDRCGWLDACPELDESWLGYFPEVVLMRLRQAGKLPEFSDLI